MTTVTVAFMKVEILKRKCRQNTLNVSNRAHGMKFHLPSYQLYTHNTNEAFKTESWKFYLTSGAEETPLPDSRRPSHGGSHITAYDMEELAS
jgi:hypothetical protein